MPSLPPSQLSIQPFVPFNGGWGVAVLLLASFSERLPRPPSSSSSSMADPPRHTHTPRPDFWGLKKMRLKGGDSESVCRLWLRPGKNNGDPMRTCRYSASPVAGRKPSRAGPLERRPALLWRPCGGCLATRGHSGDRLKTMRARSSSCSFGVTCLRGEAHPLWKAGWDKNGRFPHPLSSPSRDSQAALQTHPRLVSAHAPDPLTGCSGSLSLSRMRSSFPQGGASQWGRGLWRMRS